MSFGCLYTSVPHISQAIILPFLAASCPHFLEQYLPNQSARCEGFVFTSLPHNLHEPMTICIQPHVLLYTYGAVGVCKPTNYPMYSGGVSCISHL